MKNKNSKAAGCLILLLSALAVMLQIIFLTLKLSGAVSWGWLWVLCPIWMPIAAIAAFVLLYVLIKLPQEVSKSLKRAKRSDDEAKQYGMVRMKGETDAELKKRIITRNMITGTARGVSKSVISAHILEQFPELGGCRVTVDNTAMTILLTLTPSGTFTKGENGEKSWTPNLLDIETVNSIVAVARVLIHDGYKVIATQQGGERDGEE